MFAKSLEGKNERTVQELGGKGYSLAVLVNNKFDIPKGFVIISEAFFKFLEHNDLLEKIEGVASEIDKDNFREKSEKIKDLILGGEIPEEIVVEIKSKLIGLNVKTIAIRSSAVSEDSLKASFAGLFDTFLNIKSDLGSVLGGIKKCWASLFNERATIYRLGKSMPHLEGMAVIIQEMIPAEVSGITFTAHPMNKKLLLVEASYGIGDMIVSGRVDPDDYTVDRETLEIVERRIGKKDKMNIIYGEKIRTVDVKKGLTERRVLPDKKVKEIALTCLEVEKIFGYPQDIEWCISNSRLWLLQSRPVTRMT